MKRVIAAFTLIFTFALFVVYSPLSAKAVEISTSETFTLNEIELYRAAQRKSEEDLSIQGYTSDAIAQLKSTNYEDLVYARAQLPTETLIGMGYTVKEISILRAYKGEYIERGSEVYGLAGVLTAEIVCTSASTNRYNVSYHWSWDHTPFVNAVDAMGIRWVAIASDGLSVDTSAFSSVARVTYTYYPGDSIDRTYSASDSNFSSETNFNALTCTFSMTYGSSSDPYYALSGSLTTTIQKDAAVSRDIYYLKICGVYGHSIINIGAPSVSFTPGDTSIGISFTGGLSIDNIGIKKYKIYTNGTKVAIDA